MSVRDEYFERLDSWARFYNSQLTAHVGYLVSVFAFVGAASLGFSTSVLLRNDKYESILGVIQVQDALVRYGIPVILVALFFFWLLSTRKFCFRYLLGGVQYYVVMSYIVFEHMGLTDNDGRRTALLRDRAVRMPSGILRGRPGGIQRALLSLFEARLFVSKCREQRDEAEDRGEADRADQWNERITDKDKMQLFDVQGEEIGLFVDSARTQKDKPRFKDSSIDDYSTVVIPPKCLGFVQRELLFTYYRDYTSKEAGDEVQLVFKRDP